jgi:sugar/nucleoside kinase (ribokinase family)
VTTVETTVEVVALETADVVIGTTVEVELVVEVGVEDELEVVGEVADELVIEIVVVTGGAEVLVVVGTAVEVGWTTVEVLLP